MAPVIDKDLAPNSRNNHNSSQTKVSRAVVVVSGSGEDSEDEEIRSPLAKKPYYPQPRSGLAFGAIRGPIGKKISDPFSERILFSSILSSHSLVLDLNP